MFHPQTKTITALHNRFCADGQSVHHFRPRRPNKANLRHARGLYVSRPLWQTSSSPFATFVAPSQTKRFTFHLSRIPPHCCPAFPYPRLRYSLSRLGASAAVVSLNSHEIDGCLISLTSKNAATRCTAPCTRFPSAGKIPPIRPRPRSLPRPRALPSIPRGQIPPARTRPLP